MRPTARYSDSNIFPSNALFFFPFLLPVQLTTPHKPLSTIPPYHHIHACLGCGGRLPAAFTRHKWGQVHRKVCPHHISPLLIQMEMYIPKEHKPASSFLDTATTATSLMLHINPAPLPINPFPLFPGRNGRGCIHHPCEIRGRGGPL